MLKNKGPLLYFCFLVAMAHIVLPSMGRENFGPFFIWQLYHALHHGDIYDLKIQTPGGEQLLSDHPPGMSRLPVKQIILWSMTTGYNPETRQDSQDFADRVTALLAEDQMQLSHICRSKSDLAAYMLMTTQEKRKNCEDVYP
jgi:hypothetical protein